jgi:hypothetical protein
VRRADIHRPPVELRPAHQRIDLAQLVDGRCLADRDVVEDTQPAEDHGRKEQPGQVDPALGQLLEIHDLLGSLGDREAGGPGHDDRENARDQEPDDRSQHRGDRLAIQALGQDQRPDRDHRSQTDRQHDRVPAGKERRNQDLQGENQGQGERDERPDAAPAGNEDGDDRQGSDEVPQERQPPAVEDGERDDAVRIGVDRNDDLVADGIVGKLELAARTFDVGVE